MGGRKKARTDIRCRGNRASTVLQRRASPSRSHPQESLAPMEKARDCNRDGDDRQGSHSRHDVRIKEIGDRRRQRIGAQTF
jgi:hypothetical protein